MRKIMLFFAACVALVACKKETLTEGIAFQKGQEVTISANAGSDNNNEEKVTGSLSYSAIKYKWEEGDKIMVKVGNDTAHFHMEDLMWGESATIFRGRMPGSGNTFSVQYPTVKPDLMAIQTWEGGGTIGKDLMLFEATDCTLGTPVTLNPQYSVLRFSIYNYKGEEGSNIKINRIEVDFLNSDNTVYETYKLNTNNMELNYSAGQKFQIVVYPRTGYKLKVSVYDQNNELIGQKTTSSAIDFDKATFRDMAEWDLEDITE